MEFGGGSERVNTASADAHGRWGLCAHIMRAFPLATAGGVPTDDILSVRKNCAGNKSRRGGFKEMGRNAVKPFAQLSGSGHSNFFWAFFLLSA